MTDGHGAIGLLQAYVPSFAARFCGSSSVALQPQTTVVDGTILVADISGFTRTAAQLSQPGGGGAEAVQGLVNAVFEPVVDALLASGGDIVCFAGDAVIAFWPSATDALQASQALLDALSSNQAAVDSQLSVRVALASGDLWLAIVGSAERWYPLLGGESFREVATLLTQVSDGELRACATTLDRSHGSAVGRVSVNKPLAAEPADGADDEWLKPFVLPSLRSNANYQRDGWLAEMRQASVVFVSAEEDLCGSADLSALQGFAEAITTAAEHAGGSVNQIVIDDKGLVGVVVFGVAGHVHENDAKRAVTFAMSVQQSLEGLALQCRAGIASGKVFCGQRGGPKRRDEAVIGSCVNLAARLMSVGVGVRLDEKTRDLVAGSFDCTEIAGVALKNLPASTRAFTPKLGSTLFALEQPVGLNVSRLEGREVECAELEGAMRALCDTKRGGLWLIQGVAGIGKSALLAEFRTQMQSAGVRVLSGAADAIGTTSAYVAWRGIVEGLIALAGQTPDNHASTDQTGHATAELQATLTELLPDNLRAKLGLLNPMLPLPLVESPEVAALGPEARLGATRELLVEMLAKVARIHPLALIVEDGHWLDDLSRGALLDVVERLPNLLVVLTSRPEGQELRQAVSTADGHLIELVELEEAAANRVLQHELGVSEVPGDLSHFVYSRTGGHPLFVQQLAASLRAHPAISIGSGRCRIARHTSLSDLQLPETIAAVVTSSLDRLSLEEQIVLKVLAVVGRPVTETELEALLPETVAAQRPWLGIDPEIFTQLLLATAEGLDFRHALIRQAVYEVMTLKQLRSLHGDVADLLENQHTTQDSEEQMLGTLAFHNEHAGRIGRAIELLEKEGARSLLRDMAPLDAIQSLKKLIELDRQHPNIGEVRQQKLKLPGHWGAQKMFTRRAHWQRLLGESYAKVGESTPSVEHLGGALVELGLSLPLPRRKVFREFALGLGRRLVFAPRALRPGSLNKDERGAIVELVAAHDRFSRLCYTRGESAQGVASALHATSLAERLGPSSELCNSYCMMSNVVASFGRFDIARQYTRIAQRAAEELAQPELEALTHSLPYLWETTLWNGRAKEPMSRAVRIFDSLGDRQSAALFSSYIARLHLLAGNFELCADELTSMSSRLGEGDASHLQIRYEVARAELAYRQDDFQTSKEWATQAFVTRGEFGEVDHTIGFQLEGLTSMLMRKENKVELVRAHAKKALEALALGGAGSFCPHMGFIGIFESLLDDLKSNPSQRRELLSTHKLAIKTLRSQQRTRPYVRPLYELYKGRLKFDLGKPAEAKRDYLRGLARAHELEGPWEIRLLERSLGSVEDRSD